jgi:hypothetical protein
MRVALHSGNLQVKSLESSKTQTEERMKGIGGMGLTALAVLSFACLAGYTARIGKKGQDRLFLAIPSTPGKEAAVWAYTVQE